MVAGNGHTSRMMLHSSGIASRPSEPEDGIVDREEGRPRDVSLSFKRLSRGHPSRLQNTGDWYATVTDILDDGYFGEH